MAGRNSQQAGRKANPDVGPGRQRATSGNDDHIMVQERMATWCQHAYSRELSLAQPKKKKKVTAYVTSFPFLQYDKL